jgi:DNA-binding MarR family transcriptional regulator
MKTAEAAALYRLAKELSETLDRDAPLVQVLAFLRVAMSGDMGMDQGKLADEIALSNSGTSRTVQALSSMHYLKDRPGYGLVERVFDPTDNRKRELKLTAKGQKALDRLAEVAKKGAAK